MTGYSGDGVACEDVDECATGNGGCSADALCGNTPGGRTCVCKAGYSGDGVSCVDVDECATGAVACASEVNCTNTAGSFLCGTCPSGYANGAMVNGVAQCDDVDECAAGLDNCTATASCTNTPGSFKCACANGSFGDGVTACTGCTACAANHYASAACTGAVDTTCTQCDACAPGSFGTCTTTATPTCALCTAVCAAGSFAQTACTGLADTGCATCATCGAGFYAHSACSAVANTDCRVCTTTCTVGSYLSGVCANSTDATCLPCSAIDHCTNPRCTGAGSSECTACADSYFLADASTCQACTDTCPSEQFQTASCRATADLQCDDCDAIAHCAPSGVTCTSKSDEQCTSCEPTYFASGNTCQSCTPTCPDGEYIDTPCGSQDDAHCGSCDPIAHCATTVTCTSLSDERCAQCSPTYYLAGETCAACTVCPTGSFSAGACAATGDTDCDVCADVDHCADANETCTNADDSQCMQCDSGFFLLEGVTGDTGASGADTCVACAICPTGSYVTQACSDAANTQCGLCAAVDHCQGVSCSGASNATCVGTCDAGWYLQGGVCVQCDAIAGCTAGALTCSGPGLSQCADCGQAAYIVANSCMACTVCMDGEYESDACGGNDHQTDRHCALCDASCLTCDGPSDDECTSCGPDLVLTP